ncbi:MAG: rhodanese family protein [Gammaproteobacteria bacterium]|nr:rhodanese family protein [Gammaproteobacteria bacterium]
MVEVREIKASEARRWLDEGRAELIDIRDPGERGQMRIPEARWIPLTGLEAGLKAEPHQKIGIFHCRSGRRTQIHADKLATVGYPETYILEGGIMAWKQAGYPVASDSGAPIEIMRQVQIAAGSLVLLGVILGVWVHPGFFGLSAFIGAGLLFSGATGSCGMAMMLAKLPFNR